MENFKKSYVKKVMSKVLTDIVIALRRVCSDLDYNILVTHLKLLISSNELYDDYW